MSQFKTKMLPTLLALGVIGLSSIPVGAQVNRPTPGRTTITEEAAIKDPRRECTRYYHPTVVSALGSFPPIWQSATILPGDTNAQALWNLIQPSVPNIVPKGTLAGDFENEIYSQDDPDCWWTISKCTTPKIQGIPPDISSMPEPHTLGYGFDDGPNCSHNAFYDYLQAQKQRATMFFIGSNVLDWPLEAARAVEDGHEVCVHGWSHQFMTAFSSEGAFAELYYNHLGPCEQMQAVRLATGVTPTCWRPPFGDVDDRIRAIAAGLGLRTVLWQYDSQDWQVGTTAEFTPEMVDREYDALIDDAKRGAFDAIGTIILMHELNDFTMRKAMAYHPKLLAVFQHIVPVAVGLNITRPYVENNYTLPTFAEYNSTGLNLATNIRNSTNSSTTSSSLPTVAPTGRQRVTADASRLAWVGDRSVTTGVVVALALSAFTLLLK